MSIAREGFRNIYVQLYMYYQCEPQYVLVMHFAVINITIKHSRSYMYGVCQNILFSILKDF